MKVCPFGTNVTQINHTKKWREKTVPQLCVRYQVQETEIIRNTQHTRYHRTRTQTQDAIMKYTRHKVQDFENKFDLRFRI